MYIIYNHDGSVLKKNLTDYIQQGDNNVSSIFIGINGYNSTQWNAVANFRLPNGDLSPETPTEVLNFDDDGKLDGVYNGWSVPITSAETIYTGTLNLSIKVFDNNTPANVLFTILVGLVVNPAVVEGDEEETLITYAQYESLLTLVNQKAPKDTTMRFFNYNASGKTVADLESYIKSITNHDYVCGLNLSNLTEGGSVSAFSSSFIAVVVKNTSTNKYYLEIERYASGTRASQDRWVARELIGTELLDTILTPYNEYYAPYLVNGNNFNYDTATYKDLKDVIGEVPHIIRLSGTSEDSSTYGGFYIVKLGSGTLTALRLTNISEGIDDFYYGYSISNSTLLSAIFNHSSSYYKPYARKSELKEGTMTFVRYNASGKTIADLVTYLNDGANIVHSFWLEGIDNPARYIGGVFKVTRNGQVVYDLELERVGSGPASAQDRWVARSLTGNELINDVLQRTSTYFKPYALQSYVDSNCFKKYESGITNSTTLLELEEIIGSEPCYIYNSSQQSWYLCKLFNATHYYYFEFEEVGFSLENVSYRNRYQGGTSESTTLGTILTPTSNYFKPYVLKSEAGTKLYKHTIVFESGLPNLEVISTDITPFASKTALNNAIGTSKILSAVFSGGYGQLLTFFVNSSYEEKYICIQKGYTGSNTYFNEVSATPAFVSDTVTEL